MDGTFSTFGMAEVLTVEVDMTKWITAILYEGKDKTVEFHAQVLDLLFVLQGIFFLKRWFGAASLTGTNSL